MTYAAARRFFTVKALIRAAFTALSIASIGAAHSATYHAPQQNSHQNNWMGGGGG
jgi:hypothetical protein